MQIVLKSHAGTFARVSSLQDADRCASAIIRRKYSDIYYTLIFSDGHQISGQIDLLPYSFHAPHIRQIFTNHVLTVWGNISRLDQKPGFRFGYSLKDIHSAKEVFNKLQILTNTKQF